MLINRDFGADFAIEDFRHRAVSAREEHRIEMHLLSLNQQTVHIPGAGSVELREGETLRTEISCKYDRARVAQMHAAAGLELEEWSEDLKGIVAWSLAAHVRAH